jgi:hypothetical protein
MSLREEESSMIPCQDATAVFGGAAGGLSTCNIKK